MWSAGGGRSEGPGDAAGRGLLLFVTELDLSLDNGPGINEREFVLAVQRRYPGTVVCVAPRPATPDKLGDAHIQYASGGTGGALQYLRFLFSAYHQIRRLLRTQTVDALVFRLGGTPILPFVLGRLHRRRIILKKLALYAIFGEQSVRGVWKNRLSRLLFPMYRSVVHSAMVADTESIPYVDWLHETFGVPRERLVVIRNGANTDLFVPPPTPASGRLEDGSSSFILGYVGALSRMRHVDWLVRAVARLGPDIDVSLVLVGDGTERSLIEAMAREKGVEDLVTFAGAVPYEEVPGLIGGFDAGIDLTAVQMTIRGQTVISSYSQKIPQYLSCGVPVIAWRCSDTEYIERADIGRLVAFGDEDGLVASIFEMASLDLRSRTLMRRRARDLAEAQFSAERLVESRMDLWRNTLSDAGVQS